MANLQTMYPGVANSPDTFLKEDLAKDGTVMYLSDGSVLGALPTLAVIGGGADAETVLVTSIRSDGGFTIQRSVEGEQKAWKKADLVARNWTNKDYEAIRANITAVNAEVLDRQYLHDILMGESLVTRKAGEWPVVHGKPTIVEAGAFYQKQLTSVIIPPSVTTIENWGFKENQLASVIIPPSVTSIGESAFAENQLTEVKIPNSVTDIKGSAFAKNQLTEVKIPNSVTDIEGSVFQNNQLTEVKIPKSVTCINGWAFFQNQLTEVTIPKSVTRISLGAFVENQLTEVKVPKNCTVEDGAFDDDVNIIRY